MAEYKIVNIFREALGLVATDDAIPDVTDNLPLRFLGSVDFSIGRISDQLIDGIEAGVLVFDPDGSLIRANPAARRILRAWDLSASGGAFDGLCDGSNAALGRRIWDVIGGSEASVAAGKPCGAFVLLDDIGQKRQLHALMESNMWSDDEAMITASGSASVGAIRNVTVLYADIRGFKLLAKTLGARRVVELLNEYFPYMADVIGAEHGIIDKYIGDAIMALFGVPASQNDDADHAVAAARSMHRSLKLMNGLRGAPALRIGIGLGSGPAIVGKIGSPDRMNYTVIGDPASLASRVEGITQAYGCDILICGETFNRLTRPIPARRVDVVILPGWETPMTIYEVFMEDPGAAATGWLSEFDSGVSAYLADEFCTAQKHLSRAKDLNSSDMLAEALAQRCRRLALRGSEEWTGAWKLTENIAASGR
jgi:class 3 adenylate cyclase